MRRLAAHLAAWLAAGALVAGLVACEPLDEREPVGTVQINVTPGPDGPIVTGG